LRAESRNLKVTAEEQAAIIQFLKEPGAAGAGAGRARTLARAVLRFAGVLLLAAGVVAGYADGDEFDEAGCSVALRPGEGSHAAHSGQQREREGGKLPRSDGGSAGGCGGGGGPDGRPEWEARAALCAHRMPDGQCQRSNRQCAVGNAERLKAEILKGERGPGEAEIEKAETFPINLLKQVLDSTLEQQAAIDRFLKAEPLRKALAPGNEAGHIAPTETTGPLGYSLRREAACWVLVFPGQQALLKREIGLVYAAHLLSQPGECVPCAMLFSEFSTRGRKDHHGAELPDAETGALMEANDGMSIGPLARDRDEAEARERHYAQLCEYKDAFNDASIPRLERAEARQRYDEMRAFLKKHYHPQRDAGSEVTRNVHRSIQRLCHNLRKPVAGQKAPDPAAAAFAEYIERHILVPSRRYTRAKPGSNVRLARGELAGRLIFECPPGHRWSVHT
jgi:hypothetical protein